LKTVEQAAAESLLQQLPHEPEAPPQPAAVASPTAPQPSGETKDSSRAPIALNELRQAGLLRASGFEIVDQTGPSHQPTFTVVAWGTTPEGRTIRAEPVSGSSKKSAQRAAAAQLLDLLVNEGITGR